MLRLIALGASLKRYWSRRASHRIIHWHSEYASWDPSKLRYFAQEFLAGTLNLAALNKAENLKSAFESFDIDGDGKITREELQAGLKVGAYIITPDRQQA